MLCKYVHVFFFIFQKIHLEQVEEEDMVRKVVNTDGQDMTLEYST